MNVEWAETYGKRPKNLSATDFFWLHFNDGVIELVNSLDGFEVDWHLTTHYRLAPEIEVPDYPEEWG